MNYAALTCSSIGWAVALYGFAWVSSGRAGRNTWNAVGAGSMLWWTAADVLGHAGEIWIMCDAAIFAWFAYRWWTGGGGDDTKKRLRRWVRKWSPVRRTAPQGA